jgi:hypothetical protein
MSERRFLSATPAAVCVVAPAAGWVLAFQLRIGEHSVAALILVTLVFPVVLAGLFGVATNRLGQS